MCECPVLGGLHARVCPCLDPESLQEEGDAGNLSWHSLLAWLAVALMNI